MSAVISSCLTYISQTVNNIVLTHNSWSEVDERCPRVSILSSLVLGVDGWVWVQGKRSRAVLTLTRHQRSRDEHWTWLGLGWILNMTNFLCLDSIRTISRPKIFGSGPDVGWFTGKELGHFCFQKGAFFKYFGLHLDLDWVLKILAWIWIIKCNSPVISAVQHSQRKQSRGPRRK